MTRVNTSEPIFLAPVFQNKIWGGRALADDWGYQIPEGPVGECWAISAHPHGDCVIAQGDFKGLHLSELWTQQPELFGDCAGDRFPLLIKIIDAKEALSVQVHPDDRYAHDHEGGSLGKRECWYVLDAADDATIVIGQRARSREEFAQKVEEGDWDSLLNTIPCRPGDFFQVEPGTVHAIKENTVILETQQSSDVTYRVYDYDRRQDDGSLRELHLAQSLDVIDYDTPCISSGEVTAAEIAGVTQLMDCPNFAVFKLNVAKKPALYQRSVFQCFSVIAGEGSIQIGDGATHKLKRGDHLVIPAGSEAIELSGDMIMIASYPH